MPLTPVPRALHPGAWWLWALGLATATTRTTNPLLLLLILTVAGYVVVMRRSDAPWSRAYRVFLYIGLILLGIRVLFQAVMGPEIPGHLLVDLPQAHLPDSFGGVRLGGPVTLEGVLVGVYDGLGLAVLLACVGAANSLVNPSRLLACVPGALYEMGVVVVVAMSFAPHTLTSARRIRAAHRLRGRPNRGFRGLRGIMMPVLEGALERSLELAASMDSRGYGRQAGVPAGTRRLTALLTLGGLLGILGGSYGLLTSVSPASVGLPMLATGVVVAALGMTLGGRRVSRTRYRPDPWALPEWLVAASGIAAAAALLISAGDGALRPAASPLAVPELPLLPVLGILCALLPAWAAPPVPGRVAARARAVPA